MCLPQNKPSSLKVIFEIYNIYQKIFLNSREYDRTSGWKFYSLWRKYVLKWRRFKFFRVMFSVLVISKYSILVLFVEFGSLQIFEMHAWSSLVSLILLIHIFNMTFSLILFKQHLGVIFRYMLSIPSKSLFTPKGKEFLRLNNLRTQHRWKYYTTVLTFPLQHKFVSRA